MGSPITIALIIITVITSIRAFGDMRLQHRMIFNPYLISRDKDYIRFLTSGLIHADFLHLAVNMYVLWAFGQWVERAFGVYFGVLGGLLYLVMYLAGIVASHLISYFKHRDNMYFNSLGASGAVSAVLFSAILIFPTQKLYLIFIPIGIPAYIFGLLYLVYCQVMGSRGADNINHDAHFAGALFGMAFTAVLKPMLIINLFQLLLP